MRSVKCALFALFCWWCCCPPVRGQQVLRMRVEMQSLAESQMRLDAVVYMCDVQKKRVCLEHSLEGLTTGQEYAVPIPPNADHEQWQRVNVDFVLSGSLREGEMPDKQWNKLMFDEHSQGMRRRILARIFHPDLSKTYVFFLGAAHAPELRLAGRIQVNADGLDSEYLALAVVEVAKRIYDEEQERWRVSEQRVPLQMVELVQRPVSETDANTAFSFDIPVDLGKFVHCEIRSVELLVYQIDKRFSDYVEKGIAGTGTGMEVEVDGESGRTEEREVCPICLMEYEEKEKLIELHPNNRPPHTFHKDCLYKWFESASTCPTCRKGYPPIKNFVMEPKFGVSGEQQHHHSLHTLYFDAVEELDEVAAGQGDSFGTRQANHIAHLWPLEIDAEQLLQKPHVGPAVAGAILAMNAEKVALRALKAKLLEVKQDISAKMEKLRNSRVVAREAIEAIGWVRRRYGKSDKVGDVEELARVEKLLKGAAAQFGLSRIQQRRRVPLDSLASFEIREDRLRVDAIYKHQLGAVLRQLATGLAGARREMREVDAVLEESIAPWTAEAQDLAAVCLEDIQLVREEH